MQIYRARADNKGTYRCEASNKAGTETRSLNVQFEGKRKVVVKNFLRVNVQFFIRRISLQLHTLDCYCNASTDSNHNYRSMHYKNFQGKGTFLTDFDQIY